MDCRLSVDKCVTTWNYMFPDDKIPRTETGMQKICDDAEEADGEDGGGEGGGDGDGDGGGVSNSSLTLISGASYGSSFVGMVYGNFGVSFFFPSVVLGRFSRSFKRSIIHAISHAPCDVYLVPMLIGCCGVLAI